MELLTTVSQLQEKLKDVRQAGLSVGLVPTMGALHAGHASLVERCVEENDITVVSVFVNPTQFNDKNDLNSYPRDLESDCRLLQRKGAAIVFAPSVEEMYPEPDTRQFSYPPVDTVMEGQYRPGHFNGVCQIVSKLFGIVQPDRAYFGEKDFQQVAVVRQMTKNLGLSVQICPCPIVREADGLALSSRNALLSEKERNLAVNISRILFYSRDYAACHTVEQTISFVENALNALEGLEVQYFQIVDGENLQPVTDWQASNDIVGCITVFCGARPVRLIDNIRYK